MGWWEAGGVRNNNNNNNHNNNRLPQQKDTKNPDLAIGGSMSSWFSLTSSSSSATICPMERGSDASAFWDSWSSMSDASVPIESGTVTSWFRL